MKYHFWLQLRDICRDEPGSEGGDDSDGGGGNDGGGDGGADGDPKPDGKPSTKTFTQDDVNKLLAKERRQTQAKLQEQLTALEAIRQEGLTPEAKAALEAQIDTLRAQSQTEAELAKQSLAKAKREWEKTEKALIAERDKAATAYERLQIDTLLSTAMGMNGVKPTAAPVLSAYIQQRMQKVPVLGEDGKATGDHRYVVNLEVPEGDDGKLKSLQLTPDKAVAHLRENDAFAGLFASQARSGFGGQNNPATGAPDLSNMTQEQYMEWRKQRQAT